MQRTTKAVLCILSLIIGIGLCLKGTAIQVPSGTWALSGNMAETRSGAASVLLEDGRVLVSGGEGATGALASAEFFSAGSFVAAPAMNVARSGHAAVVLGDGRVLVTGGKTVGGGVTNAAEIYSPILNSWIVIASLADARSGHTATLLKDGRVLLAGGENSAGTVATLEVFDPAAGGFTFAGTLSSACKQHAAALLADGRVLIAGGSDGATALVSSQIFDPETGGVAAGPVLSTPRAGASATTLLDGKVLIAGGNNGTADLATAEIYDPVSGAISVLGSSLSVARRNHLAFLLPHNNHVLIVGGTSGETPLASAELFRPWDGNFYPTGSMSAARSGATGSSLAVDGLFLVTGGSEGASSELYGFATVKTDRDDYAPGEIVTITGSGWQPGETVILRLHEVNNPEPHADLTLTAIANSAGRIVNDQFMPEEHDLDVQFFLTAFGQISGSSAQTSFTDHTPHGTHNVNFATTGLGVATSISITGSRNIPGSGHPFTPYSATFTSPGPSGNIGAAITILTGPNALASTLTYGGFPATVPAPGGSYNLVGTSPPSPVAIPTATGTTTVTATYTFVPSNTPPAIAADNASVTVNEGQTATNTGTWSDANAGDTVTLSASAGTVVKSGTNAGGTWSWSFLTTDGPANSQMVTITANDGNGGVTMTTFALTVNNVPPTVNTPAVSPEPSSEGGSVSASATFSDPGASDGPFTCTVNYGDGSGNLIGTVVGNTCAGPAHTYVDNGTFTVTVAVTDKDSGTGSNTTTHVVENVAPSNIVLSFNSSGSPVTTTAINENGQVTVYGSFTDPGTQDTHTVVINWGPGETPTTLNLAAGVLTFSASHTYLDDNPTGTASDNYTIGATVTDDDEGSGSNNNAASVTVNNVAPAGLTLSLSPASIDENGTAYLSGSFNDQGSQDTHQVVINWGTGEGSTTLTLAAGVLTFNASHQYLDDNPTGTVSDNYLIGVTVTDDDTGSTSSSTSLTVNNVVPGITYLSVTPTSINENQSVNLSGTFLDPGTLDTHSVYINWGDGSTEVVSLLLGSRSFSVSHQYLDDNPTGTVSDINTISVKVLDDDLGMSLAQTHDVTVNNVAPVISSISASPSLLAVNNPTTITLNFSDVGPQDTHSCRFNWDAAGVPDTVVNLSGTGNTSCSATQTYTAAGVYAVAATVTDDDTGNGTTKYEYVVVYDPSAGFVTGGGWIQSPAGAYLAGPLLTGKANFGFVSKYLKGATIPTGETQFQLHFADFNFHSTSYQWLVVSGAKGQYKGKGKLNGLYGSNNTNGYGFLLTVVDGQLNGGGGVDKFRIKIWDIDNGDAVVYDNGLGASDDIDAANPQPIAGGSITIHVPKK